MIDDRLEIAVGKAAGLSCEAERPLDLVGADEQGELSCAADLRPDPLGARGRGEDQPALGTGPELEEGGLLRARRLGLRMERVARPLGIVRGIDARIAGRREPVAGGLSSSRRTDVGDDELVTVDPDPDPLADERVRHRVAGRAIADCRLLVDDPGDAEGDRLRLLGHGVEPPTFVGQELDRRPVRLAVPAGVDLVAERLACRPKLGEGAVLGEQVRLGRHEIGLGNLDRALAATLRRRVEWHAGMDLESVVTTGGDKDRVADRDAGDSVDRHRPLVVGQRVRG